MRTIGDFQCAFSQQIPPNFGFLWIDKQKPCEADGLLRPRDRNVCVAYLKISHLNGSATVGV